MSGRFRRGRPREHEPGESDGRLFLLAIIATGVAFFVAVALYAVSLKTKQPHWGRDVAVSTGSSLLAICGAYVAGYAISGRRGTAPYQEALREIHRLDRAPAVEALYPDGLSNPEVNDVIARLLRQSSKVYLIAQYLKTWPQVIHDPLVEFFERNGKLTMINVNGDDESLVGQLQRQAITRTIDPDTGLRYYRSMILQGVDEIISSYEEADAPDKRLDIYLADEIINYFAMQFDDRRLLMIFLEHFVREGSGAPAVLLNTEHGRNFLPFWESEVKGFRDYAGQQNFEGLKRVPNDRGAARTQIMGQSASP